MGEIRISESYKEDEIAPLFLQYRGQLQAQPAYIELYEDGRVIVDASAEKNSMPEVMYNGRARRYQVPNDLSVTGIDALLEEVKPLLQRVHDGRSIEWDGSNNVGHLTEDAIEAEEEIEKRIEKFSDEYFNTPYRVNVMSATDYVSSAVEEVLDEYRKADNRERYIEQIAQDAWDHDDTFLVWRDDLREYLDERLANEADDESES